MSEIAIVVKCALCNKAFAGPREAFMIALGAQINANAGRGPRFWESLAMHAAEHHRDQFGSALNVSTRFMNWCVSRMFTVDDPKVAELQDRMRWMLHQQTLKERAGDLKQRAGDLARMLIAFMDRNTDFAEIEAYARGLFEGSLQELRDTLEEPDRYPLGTEQKPPEEQKSAIIVP